MNVAIPSYNRPSTITTHAALAGLDYVVLVHDEAQRHRYAREANPPIPPERLVVTNVAPGLGGLTRQREWACRHLFRAGTWNLFADDNVRSVEVVDPNWYGAARLPVEEPGRGSYWSHAYKRSAPPDELIRVLQATAREADALGARMAGFALVDNPFFRGTKYRTVGYVIGKMFLWKNLGDWTWDHSVSMEDFRNTAQCLLQDGRVLINNFVFPRSGHYEPGGLGTYDERVPQRRQDVARLIQEYGDLFRVKNRSGFVPGTDLQVRFTSPSQVDAWRDRFAARQQPAG